MAGVIIEGLPQLRAQLERLPWRAQLRVIKPALTAAARVFVREIKRRAPKRTGALKRSPTSEFPRTLGPDHESIKVGFRRGRRPAEHGASKVSGRHAHLVDKGTGERKTRSGASRGRMPANPFFESAIESVRAAAGETMLAIWLARLPIEARRAATGATTLDGRLK